MDEFFRSFVKESGSYLRETYLPRLRAAVDVLPPGDLWWRPHEETISVGMILRHLRGNVTQWILSGIGGRVDDRARAEEFADSNDSHGDGASGPQLLSQLETVIHEAARLIENLSAEQLKAEILIQGFEVTGMRAIYHVVEHFSWHTGQAVWIAKARSGVRHGISFYDDAAINQARNDPG